jgi:hypothetical protein
MPISFVTIELRQFRYVNRVGLLAEWIYCSRSIKAKSIPARAPSASQIAFAQAVLPLPSGRLHEQALR